MISTILALAAAAPATTAPGDAKEKVKCVREDLIGSLVQTRKVCHTVAEWELINRTRAENARELAHGPQISQSNGSGG